MEQVGVREIRQNLSVFLRRVRRGESFTVTDHGAPVALLTPLPPPSDDPLGDLVALGQVVPARDRGGRLPAPVPATGGSEVTDTLLAERQADLR